MLPKQHEGFIDRNDPVENYVPAIKLLVIYDKYTSIILKQFATHTSEIARESINRTVNSGAISQWENSLITAIPETALHLNPGDRFEYSNIGFGILGLAISRAANTPYIALVKEKLKHPLEMNNTYFQIPESQKENLAHGMAGGPTAQLDYERPKRELDEILYRVPNGSLYSTPLDLAKFMKACMGYYNVLNKNNIEMLKTTQTPTNRLRSNYSYGFD